MKQVNIICLPIYFNSIFIRIHTIIKTKFLKIGMLNLRD